MALSPFCVSFIADTSPPPCLRCWKWITSASSLVPGGMFDTTTLSIIWSLSSFLRIERRDVIVPYVFSRNKRRGWVQIANNEQIENRLIWEFQVVKNIRGIPVQMYLWKLKLTLCSLFQFRKRFIVPKRHHRIFLVLRNSLENVGFFWRSFYELLFSESCTRTIQVVLNAVCSKQPIRSDLQWPKKSPRFSRHQGKICISIFLRESIQWFPFQCGSSSSIRNSTGVRVDQFLYG